MPTYIILFLSGTSSDLCEVSAISISDSFSLFDTFGLTLSCTN